ncbi:FadR/GntR family transcriptional regulator [Microvirga puerhi]|uniref:FadR family transcriptional regulator n=1 Tax=Microvirga puerhi TaxID=2876078 RepID=A0ABS7VHS9_9HYPH|nr:FadR/GntR family transcriptional regulator [Microvirga puerhi]MBZ6075059.1 FadR family transcriptional regulator [Microvirga puerhi]
MMTSMSDYRTASRTRSAHDLVAHGIGHSIMQGRYPVGSTLPGDAELMEYFGVSRTALREALKTLAAKGLIESKTKVGTRVLGRENWNMFDADILEWHLEIGVDAKFLGWLFEIRQALEPLACATAAIRRSPEQLERMRDALIGMARCRDDRRGFTRSDLAFHQAILEASGNPFLQSIGSVIGAALATSFDVSSPVSSVERFTVVMRLHQAVFDAIERKDAAGAGHAISTLIVQTAARVGITTQAGAITTVSLHAFSEANSDASITSGLRLSPRGQ